LVCSRRGAFAVMLAALSASSCGAGLTGSLQPKGDGGDAADVGSSDSGSGDGLTDSPSGGDHDATEAGTESSADAGGDSADGNDAGADVHLDASADEASGGEDTGSDVAMGDAGDAPGEAGDAPEDAGDAPGDVGDASEDAGDASDAGGEARDAGVDRGEIVRIPDGTWADWESLGGNIIGRPAVVGDSVQLDGGAKISALKVQRNRIKLVRVELPQTAESTAEAAH